MLQKGYGNAGIWHRQYGQRLLSAYAHKDLGKLKQVDLVLVTHGHGDHVGDTSRISKDYGAKVAMNADMGHTFAALNWVPYERLIRFNKSGPISPLGEGIRITMVHAEHSSDVVHTDPVSKKKTVHPGGNPAIISSNWKTGLRFTMPATPGYSPT